MAAYGLSEEIHGLIAAQLYAAEMENIPLSILSKEYPVITFGDAYAIQQEGLQLRLADGAELVGRKIGITSRAMMQQLNCTAPDYGYLLRSMMIPAGGSCATSGLNKPGVEGELAFIMGKDIDLNYITEADIIDATECVCPCFEIIDTRFTDWKFTVRDTICDNAAAARFMLSNETKPLSAIDPQGISLSIEKNGESIGSATGSAILDSSPVASVAWLANKLVEYGDRLRAGDIVLSGAFMGADFMAPGDTYTLTMDGFESLVLHCD